MAEALEREIRDLRSLFWSERDPDGRGFAPLADAYRRAGDFDQALELVVDGLDRLPGFATGHVVAARIHHDRGSELEAEISARAVLDLDEENVEGLKILAAALEARGEKDEAGRALARVREIEPDIDDSVGASAGAPDEEAPAAETFEEAGWPEVEAEAVVAADLEQDEPAPVEAPQVKIPDISFPPEPEPPEPVFDTAAFAPQEEAEPGAEDTLFDVGLLAGDEAEEEPAEVMDLAALAPDEAEEEPAEVMDFAALAPDEAEEEPAEVMDLAALAPDEAEEEPAEVMDLAALAPDEAEEEPGEVMDLAALAPDEAEEEPEAFQAASMEEEELEADGLLPADQPAGIIYTRTMADVYAAQGLTEQALEVYGRLLEESPGAPDLEARIREIQDARSATASGGEPVTTARDPDTEAIAEHMTEGGDTAPVSTPFAWTEQESAEAGEADTPVSSYFRDLLSWTPGGASPESTDGAEDAGEAPA